MTRRMRIWCKPVAAALSAAVLIFPAAGGAANASSQDQTSRAPTEKLPEFEVASVKPTRSGPGPVRIETQPGGRFTATNVTLRALIQNAYRVQSFQVVGGPDWLNADRFDIVAKADTGEGD